MLYSSHYCVDENEGLPDLSDTLSQHFHIQTPAAQHLLRHYLDSLDWRLLNAGLQLQADSCEQGWHVQLYNRQQQLLSQAYCAELGDFSQHPKLTQAIAPLLAGRALINQVSLDIRQQRLQLQDDQQKTIAELCLADETLLTPEDAAQDHCIRLSHTPVTGYDKLNRKLIKRLDRQSQLTLTPGTALQHWIKLSDINHQAFNFKPRLKFAADERNDSASLRLLAQFALAIELNQAPICDDIDSECLHDFRVAVRRSRTLLAELNEVLPRKTLQRAKRHMKRLGQISTPQRDLDVMLLNFDEYIAPLPHNMQRDLDTAYSFMTQARQKAHAELVRHLQAKPHSNFMQWWAQSVESNSKKQSSLVYADIDVATFSAARIYKSYRRVLRETKAIDSSSPPEALHNLRKSCKKLRYLMEFYRSLYQGSEFKRALSLLKHLQDELGLYQDADVHMDFFRQLQADMTAADKLEHATDKAINKLLKILERQQLECRARIMPQLARFSRRKHQQQFRQLFKA